ncbi:hypothetical protein IIA15_00365 [candidate division TA06 bacterium]|nr:hypothetical protein [candidate division TA06 bacterium]
MSRITTKLDLLAVIDDTKILKDALTNNDFNLARQILNRIAVTSTGLAAQTMSELSTGWRTPKR